MIVCVLRPTTGALNIASMPHDLKLDGAQRGQHRSPSARRASQTSGGNINIVVWHHLSDICCVKK